MNRSHSLISSLTLLQSFKSSLVPLNFTRTQFRSVSNVQPQTTLSQTQSRSIQTNLNKYKGRARRANDVKSGPLENEEIPSDGIQVVGENGRLGPPEQLMDVLHSINRPKEFIVQVSPGGENGFPICKILNRRGVNDFIRSKEKAARLAKMGPKQVELNWAIDNHDLSHRLKQLSEFLEKGRKVEIILARKKGKRHPTDQEVENVMTSVTETIQKTGATQTKAQEGEPGKRVMISVQKPGAH